MPNRSELTNLLLAEILRDAHRYVPGIEQRRPTLVARTHPRWRMIIVNGRERCRDLLERVAGRAGFSHPHFDPDVAAERLERLLELSDGLNETHALLADDHSRRALINVLKLRVLGPYHSPLPIRPEQFRSKQAYVDRKLRKRRATFEVSDPWFSPLSLYQVPIDGGSSVTLHGHSVDLVSVFLLHQYRYARGTSRVSVKPGDVVLDVGGCWGDTALYFASLVGPAGKVYTFEFDPESLEVLRANLALNPRLADRIEVVEHALWHRSGESLEFVQAGRMTRVMHAGSSAAAPRVATMTLDEFAQDAGIDRVGFVKIDVEGAELRVLSGARESLTRWAPKLAIAAYHNDDDLVQLPRLTSSLRPEYRFYLDSFSPVEEETVLFADATRLSSST